MVDATSGAGRPGNVTADPKRLSLRVLDVSKDNLHNVDLPKVFSIELMFHKSEDAIKTKSYLDDSKEKQLETHAQCIKSLLDRWSFELEVKK